LTAFGYEHMDCWDREWVELMFVEGRDRFEDFVQLTARKAPTDTRPASWPLVVRIITERLDETATVLEADNNDQTRVRELILGFSRELSGSKFGSARQTGNSLSEIHSGRQSLLDEVEGYYQPRAWQQSRSWKTQSRRQPLR
jgi:hypothetical protein